MPPDNDLHKMTPKELGHLFPICIDEPSEKWPALYAGESASIIKALNAAIIIRIDHIGSTAVPGLKAKPSIDILLQISENTDTVHIINCFQQLGYHYTEQPDNPPPHMMFVKGYSTGGYSGQAFHVHVRYAGDWDEIRFRDHLIAHPETAKEYETLKLSLASKYKNDREGYTHAKTRFIENINRLTRL